MSFVRESVMVNGKPLTFETGRLAKQAHGSILITYGESVVLVTAVSRRRAPRPRLLPAHLRVRREDVRRRQDPRRLLQARGAPARRGDPHLPHHGSPAAARSSPRASRSDTQIIATVLSSRQDEPDRRPRPHRRERGAPHLGHPVGRPDRRRPRRAHRTASSSLTRRSSSRRRRDIDLVVACSQGRDRDGRGRRRRGDRERPHRRAHVRAQGGAADPRAHREAPRRRRQAEARRSSRRSSPPTITATHRRARRQADHRGLAHQGQEDALRRLQGREERRWSRRSPPSSAPRSSPTHEKLIKAEFEERKYARRPRVRAHARSKRIDGRDTQDDPPDHDARSGLLPRVHGSALFQRGETQAIVTTTLGTSTDEQKIDAPHRRALEALHAPLQLPALLDRRDQADARPRPPRDRPRRPRRARARRA